MTRVKSLEICSMDKEKQCVTPPPLFPSATKIRIGGRMSYAFFRAILSSPENLKTLYIDNIQGLGQVADGIQLYHLGPMNEVGETDDEISIPMTRHAGPMRGRLHLLTNHCKKLRHLRISSVGQDDIRCKVVRVTRESALRGGCKLHRVRDTNLQSLTLEYGTEPDMPYIMPSRGVQGHEHVGRPMDRRFIQYTMPTLCRGPWPNLSTLTVHEIDSTPTQSAIHSYYFPEDPSIFAAAEEGLRRELGKEVSLVWERENNTSFYLLEVGGDHYK
ncbi:uncharacterized protein PAC_15133 [Phialocephala subalpina]|uniref:Uncharacterized protein n=1 Tax=Phialocephala subalpina TaxID=576137 RepID=A0A1L7XJN4_9HELO|nr:uncharacterized protein PAC_15133 [Phialocephala subalpina]